MPSNAADTREYIERRMVIDNNTGCWLWIKYVGRDGYARCKAGRGTSLAHRISYEAHRGSIPRGLKIDHLCRVRHCVNPDHMEPVTQRENIMRGSGICATHARATHCPSGHAYDGLNTIRKSDGYRGCKACKKADARRRYLEHRGIDPSIDLRPFAQTHCKHGHLFDLENTYTYKNGRRGCRACGRLSHRKRREARSAPLSTFAKKGQ